MVTAGNTDVGFARFARAVDHTAHYRDGNRFFAALQALFQNLFPGSLDDIVTKVLQAYGEYPPERCNRIFLTLQSCMREILKLNGGQHYKVPHMRKMALAGAGLLPARLPCDPAIVNAAIEFLSATI